MMRTLISRFIIFYIFCLSLYYILEIIKHRYTLLSHEEKIQDAFSKAQVLAIVYRGFFFFWEKQLFNECFRCKAVDEIFSHKCGSFGPQPVWIWGFFCIKSGLHGVIVKSQYENKYFSELYWADLRVNYIWCTSKPSFKVV